MIGSDTVLSTIQDRLLDEISDNLKYRLQVAILERGGFDRLASSIRLVADIEHSHADQLLEKLVSQGAIPTEKTISTVTSKDVKMIIEDDLADEKKGLEEYSQAYKQAIDEGDVMTAMLYAHIMHDEEGHIAFFEKEYTRVNSSNLEDYYDHSHSQILASQGTLNDSDEVNYPPEIADDPTKACADWLKENNPRSALFATGINPRGQMMKAYIVDGDDIRTNVWQDWVDGGNHQRYPWIPEGEFWLDKANEDEFLLNLIHETTECWTMETGKDYDTAHSRFANVDEFMARHGTDPQTILKAMGWNVAATPEEAKDDEEDSSVQSAR